MAGVYPLAALKTNDPDLRTLMFSSPAEPPELSTLSPATPANFKLAVP